MSHVNTFLHSPLIDRCPLEIKLSTKFSAFSISPLGLLGKKNNAEFIDRADELEKEMTQSISKQLPKDDGLLCKPKEQKEIIHFAHGLCKKCFEKFMNLSGGIDGGTEPPAFQQAEMKRKKAEAKMEESCSNFSL